MTEPARRGCAGNAALWAVALMATLATLAYQDRTGPTQPLDGSVRMHGSVIRFVFLRSETIGTDLKVVLLDPIPPAATGQVRYRRYQSDDRWTTIPMREGSFAFARRGRGRTVTGLGAELPSLRERAGKYEYFVDISGDGVSAPVSVTGTKPVYARYKASVPGPAILLHVVTIFLSMLLAIRATLAALTGGPLKRLIWATVVSLLIGGFVLGPVVQWYAFGVWWSGFPFGYDWTDNKVVVMLLFWLGALWANRGDRRRSWPVVLAGVATLVIYLIPHSIFGSEYNYRTGTGHGTAG